MAKSQSENLQTCIANLKARDTELKAEASALNQQANEIENGIAHARSGDAFEAAAQNVKANGINGLHTVTELCTRREDVQQKLRIVNRAIELNRRELETAQSELTRQVTEAAKPEYQTFVAETKRCIVAVKNALANEQGFCNRLSQSGGSMGCGVLQPMGIDAGIFDGWLADAATYYGL